MKNLIVLLSVLALIGCTKEPVNENASDKELLALQLKIILFLQM